MKYLMQFPGRHVVNRVGRTKADLDAYVDRWEKDQRVCRVIVALHWRDGMSYSEISKWLRGGPSWGRRSPDQVRRIIQAVCGDCNILAGADVEQEAG